MLHSRFDSGMRLFSDFVADALSEPVAAGHHRYLVVDTAATRPTPIASVLGLRVSATDVLTGKPCVWRESASPVLLELPVAAVNSAACSIAATSLTKWRYANCFVYLESPHDQATVLRMLRDRTEAELPQNVPVLLRYFDSRVFAELLRVWSERQARAFLSAGTRWAIPGRRGEVASFEHEDGAPDVPHEAPFKFDTAQEAALIDAGEADALVDLLLDQNNAVLEVLLPPEQHERIVAALEVGRTLGIDQVSDQAAFCSLALELGLSFHEDEPWVGWAPELQAGRLTFSEAVERAVGSEKV